MNNIKLFDDINKQVVYSNDFSEAIFENYTLKQKKLLLFLLSGLTDQEDKEYNFSPKDTKSFINMERKTYKEFSEVVCELQKKPILVLNKEKNELESISLFDKLVFKEKDKSIRVIFGNSAKKLFLGLNGNFSKYFIENVNKLKNTNSIEFYLRGESNLYKDYFIMNLIDINRACDTNYSKVSELERSLLAPALKDINTNTDINISYKKITQGKKVVSFEFNTSKKSLIDVDIEKAIKNAKKNIYISRSKVLNSDSIHFLLRKYTKIQLIEGLNYSYDKIKRNFSRLKYLENTIDTYLDIKKMDQISNLKQENKNVKISKNTSFNFSSELNSNSEDDILFLNWLNMIDQIKKLEIENQAVEKLLKENIINENFLSSIKISSPHAYENTIKKYVIEILKNDNTISPNSVITVKKKRGRKKKIDMLENLNWDYELSKNEKKIISFVKKIYGKEAYLELTNMFDKTELLKEYYIKLLIYKEKNKK